MQAIVEAKAYNINKEFFEVKQPYVIKFQGLEPIYGICFEVSDEAVKFQTIDKVISFGASDFYNVNYSIRRLTEALGDENCVENGTVTV